MFFILVDDDSTFFILVDSAGSHRWMEWLGMNGLAEEQGNLNIIS